MLCLLLLDETTESTAGGDRIAQAIRYMNRHLFEPIGVQDAAAAVSLSPSHFSRQFKARTGYSPYEYIVLRRIDKETRDLLQATYDTVNRHFGELFPTLFGGGEARLQKQRDAGKLTARERVEALLDEFSAVTVAGALGVARQKVYELARPNIHPEYLTTTPWRSR